MKYWCYNEPIWGKNNEILGNEVKVFSEKEILDFYYPTWYSLMCKKFGQQHVDEHYREQDCIDDWVVINWAWESKDGD